MVHSCRTLASISSSNVGAPLPARPAFLSKRGPDCSHNSHHTLFVSVPKCGNRTHGHKKNHSVYKPHAHYCKVLRNCRCMPWLFSEGCLNVWFLVCLIVRLCHIVFGTAGPCIHLRTPEQFRIPPGNIHYIVCHCDRLSYRLTESEYRRRCISEKDSCHYICRRTNPFTYIFPYICVHVSDSACMGREGYIISCVFRTLVLV